MRKIEDWLNKNKYDFIKHQDQGVNYIMLPFCLIMKMDGDIFISFDVEESKSQSFFFLSEIAKAFDTLKIYEDCYFELDEYDRVQCIYFGEEAEIKYREYIVMSETNPVEECQPKNVVWN